MTIIHITNRGIMTKPAEAAIEMNLEVGMNLEIGMAVDSYDHRWGVLDDIVVDPVRLKVTHLVVQPRLRHHSARLIPFEAVASCDHRIRLSLSTEEIEAAPKAETTDFVRSTSDRVAGLGYSSALVWPYYSTIGSSNVLGYSYGYGIGAGHGLASPAVVTTTYDRVPDGTVEVRRNSKVVTSDQHVAGHVDGFVIDGEGAITHLVLSHGHLWAHREITIPLEDIAHVESDSVRLGITRDAVGNHPSVPFKRH